MEFMPNKLYYKIREVCEIVGLEPHVLRFWETEFPSLSPPKSKKGQRTYRSSDIETILEIRKLLYEDGYTIAGARKHMGINSTVTAKRRTHGEELQSSENDLKPVSSPSPELLPFFDFTHDEVKAINREGADKDFTKVRDGTQSEFVQKPPVPGCLTKTPALENMKASSTKSGAYVNTPDSERLKRVQKELENMLTLLERE